MTTKVKIIPEIHQSDRVVKVAVVNTNLDGPVRFLRAGETAELYAYDGQCLEVSEVPVVATLLPHQQRMVAERDELATRFNKLDTFISNLTGDYGRLPEGEQKLLVVQRDHMQGYLATLDQRIAAFLPEVQ